MSRALDAGACHQPNRVSVKRLRPLADSSYHFVLRDFEPCADGLAAILDAHYPVGAYYATWLLLSDAFSRSEGGKRVQTLMNIASAA